MHAVIMLDDHDWKWYSNFVKKKEEKKKKSDIRIMWWCIIIIRKSLGVNYGLGGKNTNGISCTNSLDLEGRSQKSRSL